MKTPPHQKLVLAVALAAVLTVVGAQAGETIVGTASVIDGDTIEIHGQRIRLHGIDTPESSQLCERDGKPYRCGQVAALALSDRIGRRPVSCEGRDMDRYGRVVAVCSQSGEDLNAWLVRQGYGVAYRKYSLDYVHQEEAAQKERIGMWSGRFVMPWLWRRGERLK
jgi:endonuclease YncB( thermonuclease family)